MPHAARVESGITAWFYFCLTCFFINLHGVVALSLSLSLSHTHTHTHTHTEERLTINHAHPSSSKFVDF